jgi:hypothetical protein
VWLCKEEKKGRLIMKKIIFAMAVLAMTVPAYATVTITCAETDGNCVMVSFVNDDAEMNVRAFALDIQLDTADACVCDVNCVNADYTIYPGSIVIDEDGVVTDDGTCLCDDSYPQTLPGLDSNGVTIEMGSLYEMGVDPEPAQSGDLVEICLCGCGPVNVSISENAIRGGVVMEDPDVSPTVVITGCSLDLGICVEPTCWDNINQCGGQDDGDGTCDGSVLFDDLAQLKASFFKNKGDVGYNCCADYDQSEQVNFADLAILKANFFNSGYTPATGIQDCPP